MAVIYMYKYKKLRNVAAKANLPWALKMLSHIQETLDMGWGAILDEPDGNPTAGELKAFIKALRAEGFEVTYYPSGQFQLNIEWADNKKELQAFLEE